MGLKGLTTILTLHSPGGSVDSRYVKPIFRPFCDDYQVVVFDLRGCGRSEDVGAPSLPQPSAGGERVREKLTVGPGIVAGGGRGWSSGPPLNRLFPGGGKGFLPRGAGAGPH